MQKYRALFIEQSREHLEQLSRILAADNLSPAAVDEIFRHVHSIKGMAASMGFDPIATLAHRFEDVVGSRRATANSELEAGLVDVLLAAVDALTRQVESIATDKELSEATEIVARLLILVKEKAESTPPAVIASPPQTESIKTHIPMVRVRTDILDNLIDAVGELFITREQLRRALAPAMTPDVRAALDQLDGRVRDVQARALAVRMTPLRTLTDRYPRVVRDTARALGKEVRLVVQGESLEMDRSILDNLDTPFVHAIRNAIDHGIEDPRERAKRGKEETGQITISAGRDHDVAVIAIEDDGRGLDAEMLVKTAIAKGLISEAQAEMLTLREIHQLVCLPGFSTKQEVTDVSGRGVGMDAIRAHVEALGGQLNIDSLLGVCTRIIMRIPLTLSIIHVLRFELSGSIFAVPLARVVAVRDTDTDVINEASGKRFLSLNQALAPLHELAPVLDLPSHKLGAQAIVVDDGRNLVALAVDRAIGTQEVVVKPVGAPLDQLGWISGATVLADGRPVLILDLAKLLHVRGVADAPASI